MSETTYKVKEIVRSGKLPVDAPPERVLPLFTPMGEYQWIPGWDLELIYPEGDEPRQGTIFINRHLPDAKTYWLTIAYDPDRRVATYVNVTPEIWIMRLDVTCEATPENTTAVTMTYALTSLSDQGERIVDHLFSEDAFQARIQQFEAWLNYALVHGEPKPGYKDH